MITPSPNAVAYPVTRQFQEVHTYVPGCAVCNLDNSDCTTVYATRTYNWCSAVVPCYGCACTITDCAQWVTFSHANTYALRTAACGSGGGALCSNHGRPTEAAATTSSAAACYVEAIVTKYAISYVDYSEGRYSRVRVERCLEHGDAECEVWYERWAEQVYEEEEVIVMVPVTVNTYCPEPTTITYAGSTVTVLEAPTTVVFVTESRVISTVTVTRLSTTTGTTTAYSTPGYSSRSSRSSQSSYGTSTTRHFSSMPQYPAETPYPRPSPTSYYSTTPTPHYSPSPSPQHPKYPSEGYEEEEEEEDGGPEYHDYGRFKNNEGLHEWGRFYDSELRKRQLWGEYRDNEEAHSYGRYEAYGKQQEQKVHLDGVGGHKSNDKAVDSFE
ncbi:unnamed protein product [Tuber melanosporum]|uniref:(Perigord truffle) hypothetical protein n=1 Tax=Tuber melanosporum (strain Mel28) TaxID=656061 RepID=D5GI10_TUBMM|nr:uncharacterized protein GSTUM_00008222001 [Tuber melanosporum]CAZ84153.1 unnamed protein product [Tuber melanosporum]